MYVPPPLKNNDKTSAYYSDELMIDNLLNKALRGNIKQHDRLSLPTQCGEVFIQEIDIPYIEWNNENHSGTTSKLLADGQLWNKSTGVDFYAVILLLGDDE